MDEKLVAGLEKEYKMRWMKASFLALAILAAGNPAQADGPVVSIDSLIVSLEGIDLIGGPYRKHHAAIFGCDPYLAIDTQTYNPCRIDLAAPESWAQKRAEYNVFLPAGTYDEFTYSLCTHADSPPTGFDAGTHQASDQTSRTPPTFGFRSSDYAKTDIDYGKTALLKGKVVIDGEAWYTTEGESAFTTDTTKYDYTKVPHPGCRHEAKLFTPLVVPDTGRVQVELLINMRNMVYLVDGWRPFCTLTAADRYLCINSLTMMPAVQGISVETYALSPYPEDISASVAAGLVDLFYDSEDNFMGGYARSYKLYDKPVTEPAGSLSLGLGGYISEYLQNADGSVKIQMQPPGHPAILIEFTSFRRESHSGEASVLGEPAVPYYARKLE